MATPSRRSALYVAPRSDWTTSSPHSSLLSIRRYSRYYEAYGLFVAPSAPYFALQST